MATKSQTKFIIVTGGVLSGLGKGITAASIGNILKARGFSLNMMKCDPYLNTDAGTLNPAEHGEVFVTADGAETDLDLGHYERFIDRELTRRSSLMSGKIYAKLIADEREGKYLGKTVQMIPHVTSEIMRQVRATGRGYDIHIVEIGGTVGDYEALPFIEAMRQLKRKVGTDNICYVHLVYLPYLETSQELKTKPAQNAIRNLREAGITPDVIIARSERAVSQSILDKLALFGDLDSEAIVPLPNAATVYDVPLMLEQYGAGDYITKQLKLPRRRPKLDAWRQMVKTIKTPGQKRITVGVVAKYMDQADTYMSVFEAVKSAAWANQLSVDIVWIDAEKLEKGDSDEVLKRADGLVVPGGFGARGVEGKIRAAGYAIDHLKPYLGLCYGLHMAAIALARRALDSQAVNTMEIDPVVEHPVISLLADQTKVTAKGGTMRLGDYPCVLDRQSLVYKLYGQRKVYERHRHRYEFNNAYRDVLTKAGLRLAGQSPDGRLVELIEMAEHPFFVASQFHPEFRSRPGQPHPLFDGFIKAAAAQADNLKVTSKLGVHHAG